MRSPTYFLAFALGLLPSLSVAFKCDDVAIENLPDYATSDGPFVLRSDDLNVQLKLNPSTGYYIPVLGKGDEHIAKFELKHGNLTTADFSAKAVYSKNSDRAHKLSHLYFAPSYAALSKDEAETVLVTKPIRSDGTKSDVLTAWFLNGGEFGMLISFSFSFF